MNKERVQQAIDIMKRAGKVYMGYYHSVNHENEALTRTVHIGKTEADLHQCGAAACFAGWVSVSPEFQSAGGHPGIGGAPHFGESGCMGGAEAIAEWLGIPFYLASGLVFNEPLPGESGLFYDKALHDVTREDVISKLEAILAGELS